MKNLSAIAVPALCVGLLASLPTRAGAQITTGLTPPAPERTAEERAAAESTIVAVRDSVAEAERLSMRAWVDSAASSLELGGVPVTPMPDVPGDSLVPEPAPASPAARPSPDDRPTDGSPPTTRFREGAPAPDTATPLPALLLLGAGLLTGGAALLRRR